MPRFLLSIEDPIYRADCYEPTDLGKLLTLNALLQTFRIVRRTIYAIKTLTSSTSTSSSTSSLISSISNKERILLLFNRNGLIRLAVAGGYNTTTLPQPNWRFPFSLKSLSLKINNDIKSKSESEKILGTRTVHTVGNGNMSGNGNSNISGNGNSNISGNGNSNISGNGNANGGNGGGGTVSGAVSTCSDSVSWTSTNSSSALSSIPLTELNYFTSQPTSITQSQSLQQQQQQQLYFNLQKSNTPGSVGVGVGGLNQNSNNSNLRQLTTDQQQQQHQQQQQRYIQQQQQLQQQQQQQQQQLPPYGTHGVPELALTTAQANLGQGQGQGQGRGSGNGSGSVGALGSGYAGTGTGTGTGYSTSGYNNSAGRGISPLISSNVGIGSNSTLASKYGTVLNNNRLMQQQQQQQQQQQKSSFDGQPIVSLHSYHFFGFFPFCSFFPHTLYFFY